MAEFAVLGVIVKKFLRQGSLYTPPCLYVDRN